MKLSLTLFVFIFILSSLLFCYSNRDIGDRLIIAMPALVLGLNYKDKQDRKEFFLHFLSTNLGIAGLQYCIDEKRPDYVTGDKKDAFPSGHAGAAFQSATYMHQKHGFKKSIFYYVLASYVGYTRVEADRHYWHDVAGSFAVSYLMSKIVVSSQKNSDKQIILSLNNTPDQKGYMISASKQI